VTAVNVTVMQTTTTVRIGALVLAGASFLTACSSGSSSSKVATLGGAGGASTTAGGHTSTTASKEDQQQALLDFTKCMRDHGVDMPDPQVNADGGVTIQVGSAGAGDAPDKSKVDAAQTACRQYLDKAQGGAKPPTPQEQQEMQQKQLDFAKCMRDHGINFPDPQFSSDGKVTQSLGPDSGVDPSSPAFQLASDTCSKQVGLPNFGTGGKAVSGGTTSGSTGAQP
jgi:hypothetical protein